MFKCTAINASPSKKTDCRQAAKTGGNSGQCQDSAPAGRDDCVSNRYAYFTPSVKVEEKSGAEREGGGVAWGGIVGLLGAGLLAL